MTTDKPSDDDFTQKLEDKWEDDNDTVKTPLPIHMQNDFLNSVKQPKVFWVP